MWWFRKSFWCVGGFEPSSHPFLGVSWVEKRATAKKTKKATGRVCGRSTLSQASALGPVPCPRATRTHPPISVHCSLRSALVAAWTGALAAFILGMPLMSSLSAIFAGVLSAGAIMSALTLSGKKGGLAALAALVAYAATQIIGGGEKKQDFLEAKVRMPE